jgi:hypothetical protein
VLFSFAIASSSRMGDIITGRRSGSTETSRPGPYAERLVLSQVQEEAVDVVERRIQNADAFFLVERKLY